MCYIARKLLQYFYLLMKKPLSRYFQVRSPYCQADSATYSCIFKYSRRWGEFRMQVIAYKVRLLIRYKYTIGFQKILLSLFRAWSGGKFLCLINIFKSGHIIYHWTRNFMLIKKNNNLMGKKIKS